MESRSEEDGAIRSNRAWGQFASEDHHAIAFHPDEASARAAATAQADARPKSKPTGPAPSNLREQLRAEALSRSGVFNSRGSRAEFDAAFDALWNALETEATKLREDFEGAADDLRQAQRENERLTASLAAAKALARDMQTYINQIQSI